MSVSGLPFEGLTAPSGGLFLTFEGGEGAGKTTQIGLLESALRQGGIAVTRTREPGGDRVGEQVRDLLLHAPVHPHTELLLFAAARSQNVQTVILPALAQNHVVLCDRFTDSTRAYQGAARGLPPDVIETVNAFATSGLIPHRTFLLDLPPEVGLSRQTEETQNHLDRETLTFHQTLRQAFTQIAKREPERVQIVDATRPPEAVFADLQTAVASLLVRGSQ